MKRKLLTFICVVALVVCSAVALTACGGNDDNQTTVGHQHSLTLEEEKPATCTEDGYIAYYACSGCDKWFADKDGTTEITDKSTVMIPRGHKLTPVEEKSATCTADGNIAYYVCSGCQKWFSDNGAHSEIVDKSQVVVPAGHKLTYVAEKAASCTEDGNTAHYICKGCDKMFTDNAAQTEITDKSSVVIAHTGHSLTHVEEKAVTCFVDGNIDYYVCGVCEKWFEDGAGETEITDKSSVVIVHNGHNYKSEVCTVCGIHKPTDGLSYIEYDNYCRVAGIGTATGTNIYIADFYNGKPVTEIGSDAFKNCSSIESVTIPDGVTEIGNYAFEGCGSLKSITIPTRVTGIGENVFRECSSLTSISIPDNVTSIGYRAFENCSGLTSVTIGKSVKTIGGWAFSGCDSLTSVNIPDNVTSIGLVAFKNCSKLTSITIGNGVTSIGNSAFSGCILLESIIIPDGITVIEGDTFKDCSSLESVRLPETLTTIEYNSFFNCTGLSNVIIPDGVTKIGGWAFSGCSSLESVIISESVATIGETAFAYCDKLAYISVDDNNTSYASLDGILYNKEKTEIIHVPKEISGPVTLPDSIISISCNNSSGDNFGFYDRGSLTSIIIPDSVTDIETFAFSGCYALTIYCEVAEEQDGWQSNWNYQDCPVVWNCKENEEDANGYIYAVIDGIRYSLKDGIATVASQPQNITAANIPTKLTYKNNEYGVTSIGDSAFTYCNSLESITIPSSVTSMGDVIFYRCSSLKNVIIPDSVTSLGSGTFRECSSLKNVKLPNKLTSIESGTFEDCAALESVTIPDGVTEIGARAFYGCSSLTSINIPDGVTDMGWEVFDGCDKLQFNEFDNAYYLGNATNEYGWLVKVKNTSITSCIVNENTSFIMARVFADCNALESLTLPFVGSSKYGTNKNHFGYIFGADYYNDNYKFVPASLKTVTVTGGEHIDGYAFYGCNSLINVILPDSLESVGWSAFGGCTSLESITIPFVGANKDGTGSSCFGAIFGANYNYDNPTVVPASLKKVIITGGEQIAESAFDGCDSITDITLPGSLKKIDWGMVNDVNGSIDRINYVGDIAGWCKIEGLSGLMTCCKSTRALYIDGKEITGKLVVPDSVTSIGDFAFYGCGSLTSVVIPDSVTTIGECAFENCGLLSKVIIGNGITEYNGNAFGRCDSLQYNEYDNAYYLGNESNPYLVLTGVKDTSVTSCVTHENTKIIGGYAFWGDSSLTSVTIGNSVSTIGMWAFSGCSSLERITLPAGVLKIGDSAFEDCDLLEVIFYNGDMVSWCKIEGLYELMSCGKSTRVLNIGGKEITGVLEIANGVTYIANGAFANCNSLTGMTIPSSVTGIGDYAFANCGSLIGLTIPDSVESIGDSAFSGCGSLTGIVIANSVKSIGYNAFYNCGSLETITYKGTMYSWCKIEGLSGLMEFGKSDKTIFVGGKSLAGQVSVSEGIKSIGDYAFANCHSITEATIYSSVTNIGGSAFKNCSSLESITISNGVENIGWEAFYGCCSLKNITLSNSLTIIGGRAFKNCDLLESITISAGLTRIEFETFINCSSLTSITFKGTVSQWQAIEKQDRWDEGTGNYTIHCTDGDIVKE